ncbi:MAG: hypothetical protein FWC72_06260 [Oscillospiraceae bacterium]|nr:hypothetical protein [Oscillospiraceae bacterium]
MRQLKLIGGILLIALALILTFLALLFPDNGLFAALWNAGIATFRGVPSLLVIYLASALFLVCGLGLLVSRRKKEGA